MLLCAEQLSILLLTEAVVLSQCCAEVSALSSVCAHLVAGRGRNRGSGPMEGLTFALRGSCIG